MVANPNFAERIAEVRNRSAKLRCEAFVDYSPVVCGMVLNPVTLASYNRLIAFENAFAVGGPVDVEAILTWVWVQHPEFGQMAGKAKQRVFARTLRALSPACPNFNAFVHLVSTLPRFRWMARWRVPTPQDRFDEAVEMIRHLMEEALYGFPRQTRDEEAERLDAEERAAERAEIERETGKKQRKESRFDPGAAIAFQAQILNTFRRDYGMSYAETEALPLKRLSQLWREHLWTHANDKTGLKLMDPEEAKLWAGALEPEETTRG